MKSNKSQKKVCLFGIYDSSYARNKVWRKGLVDLGYQVEECVVDPSEYGRFKKYIYLYKKGKRIKKEEFSYIIVAFPGQSVVWLAYLLFGRDIVFDAFLSFYNSNIEDRKLYKKWHPLAVKNWILDWYACHLARYIVLDTNEHIEYFKKHFFVSSKKCIRMFISADTEVFAEGKVNSQQDRNFTVEFHGSFIPVQGIQYIIDAAIKLRDKNIVFSIVGSGPGIDDYKKRIQDAGMAEKVIFHGQKSIQDVARYIKEADVCLGNFGDTTKTNLVIPNKVFEAAALGKPIVSARVKAVTELFSDKESILLCETANSADLALKIELLYNDSQLRKKLGEGAKEAFNTYATPTKVVQHAMDSIQKIRT